MEGEGRGGKVWGRREGKIKGNFWKDHAVMSILVS